MNRTQRRQLQRQTSKTEANIRHFGESLHQHIIGIDTQLPLFAEMVAKEQITFNPVVIGMLESLKVKINEAIEILKKEGEKDADKGTDRSTGDDDADTGTDLSPTE